MRHKIHPKANIVDSVLPTILEARKYVARARVASRRGKSLLKGLTEAQIIAKIRRDRQSIWTAEYAPGA